MGEYETPDLGFSVRQKPPAVPHPVHPNPLAKYQMACSWRLVHQRTVKQPDRGFLQHLVPSAPVSPPDSFMHFHITCWSSLVN